MPSSMTVGSDDYDAAKYGGRSAAPPRRPLRLLRRDETSR
jgi:hypothetical protein